MQHNLGYNFETQGTVKPGENMEDIVTSPITVTSKLTKKGCYSYMGRHTGYRKERDGQSTSSDKNLCSNSQPNQYYHDECSMQIWLKPKIMCKWGESAQQKIEKTSKGI